MIRILVGSPVRQKPEILRQFLSGFTEADTQGLTLSFFFVDDNTDGASSALLRDFAQGRDCVIQAGSELLSQTVADSYASDGATHTWDNSAIEKIAAYKDYIIEYAIANAYDYLLFVDSDIVIDRRMILHLLSRNKEIVSNVFWTQWQPNWELEPQCFWIPSPGKQNNSPFAHSTPAEVLRQRRKDFFAMMRVPGIYQVDGLGACTLIKRSALEKGVRFRSIPNLSLLGEDRHFCIRAGVLDIPLYFDTVYPAYHIYREAYLNRVEEFKREGFKYSMCQTWYQPAPVSRKERAGRYLQLMKRGVSVSFRKLRSRFFTKKNAPLQFKRTLKAQMLTALIYTDDLRQKYLQRTLDAVLTMVDACIVFDAGSVGMPEPRLPESFSPHQFRVIRPSDSASVGCRAAFHRLWEEAGSFKPDWVLSLFASELPDASISYAMPHLLRNQFVDAYYLRRYDMWDASHYREDPAWELHKDHLPYIMRYQGDYPFDWDSAPTISVKFPVEIARVKHAKLDLAIRSFRWADASDRRDAEGVGPDDEILDPALSAQRAQTLTAPNPSLKHVDSIPTPVQP